MEIGWIGTGALGSAIIKRLSYSFQINVWNRTTSKLTELIPFGIKKYNLLEDLYTKCDIVFICLKGEEVYDDVLFGEHDLIKYLKPNSTIIDLSTISPEKSIQLHNILKEKYGVSYVECPVSGGPEGALAGSLTAITAGEEHAANEIQSILKCFCNNVHYVGSIGKAQTIKILNNLSESINLLGASEVINMGIKLGLDVNTMKEVLSTTRGYSIYMGVLFDRLINPNDSISASLEVRLKDVELAKKLAIQLNQWNPLGSLADELYKIAIKKNGDHVDQTNCFNIFSDN